MKTFEEIKSSGKEDYEKFMEATNELYKHIYDFHNWASKQNHPPGTRLDLCRATYVYRDKNNSNEIWTEDDIYDAYSFVRDCTYTDLMEVVYGIVNWFDPNNPEHIKPPMSIEIPDNK